MSNKELHPSIQQFKQFVKRHPKLIQEVRRGNYTWQEFYEEWYLLGEDDSRWDEFKEGIQKSSTEKENSVKINQVLDYVKNVDLNQVQGHITNLNQALGAISGIIAQLQSTSKKQPVNANSTTNHPFPFRKD